MKMRRKQNEIINKQEMIDLIDECDVVRIGMSVDNVPYIVPLNFGYEDDTFYFHCAKEGRKIDMIKANPNVCFELDTHYGIIDTGDLACKWSIDYASIMGAGIMTFIEDTEEKRTALNILMKKYSGRDNFDYAPKMLEAVGVMKLEVTEMTGKRTKKQLRIKSVYP